MDVAIIGAGRLGASLGYALRRKGFEIKAFSCRRKDSARESQKIIGAGQPYTAIVETAGQGTLLFLCLPDKAIEHVSQELSQSHLAWSKKYVFHTSGLQSSRLLQPLEEKGAFTASLHPVQSFAQKTADLKQFKGIYFGLEGCSYAQSLGKKIVRRLGGQTLLLDAEDKPLYHAACSMASNLLVALLEASSSLLGKISLEDNPSQILLPLVQGTLHNVKKFDIRSSLTGPVVRGDHDSVEEHLRSLRAFPKYRKIYTTLSLHALTMAKEDRRLSAKEFKALKNLLAGK